jgi:hypothetical protein
MPNTIWLIALLSTVIERVVEVAMSLLDLRYSPRTRALAVAAAGGVTVRASAIAAAPAAAMTRADLPPESPFYKFVKQASALALGVILGYAIVRIIHVDLVKAFLPDNNLANHREAISALVIGLGSAPAHEVIKYIQNLKTGAEK